MNFVASRWPPLIYSKGHSSAGHTGGFAEEVMHWVFFVGFFFCAEFLLRYVGHNPRDCRPWWQQSWWT